MDIVTMPNLKIYSFRKKMLFFADTHGAQGIDCQMVLQTDHFVNRRFQGSSWSPTEQLVKEV